MQTYIILSKSINNLLMLSVLLQCTILLCSAVPTISLTKSLSFVGSLGSLKSDDTDLKNRVIDPLQYADDSLITREGKSNKVSKLLRYLHNKAGDRIYKKEEGQAVVAAVGGSEPSLQMLDQMDDNAVISSVCDEQSGMTCKYAVKVALRAAPKEKAVIASALRHRPANVDASKVLYHKLFESAIAKAEQKGIDEKIDFGIDLLAKKTTYGWAATKAVDLAMKQVH